MAILKGIVVHDGSKFTWTRTELGPVGAAERSDFGSLCHQRVYNDAADVGFYVKGKHSTELFVLSDAEYDGELDLVARVYECVNEPTITIKIFND